ncbi:hypothetical protein Pcinc_003938 [Petrolisthes cinctipes]|uniref:Uncharacterized protein n=1 Tax=Petrolisthes cinctipes TaxID=88211 RepID=A0AAE1GMH8_PETCI|nr:hypothetical protein Pcinc_010788 [Petrolisthes cinctipes]KAK3892203.1 hypothetical protein Pcinc_003938 [Petrolisthes cinctipes]
MFNDSKFQLLRNGSNQEILRSTSFLTSNKQVIPISAHVKCLGVHLSEDGTFKYHIQETEKKARRMAGWVLRTFYSREEDCMLTLWRTLIQPKLDYCCQLWSPHKAVDIQAMESVQRAYTWQIRGLKDVSYWARLKKLGQYSQQRRRDRYIAIYTWKILENLVPNPSYINKLLPQINPRTRRKCQRKIALTHAPARIKTLLTSSLCHNGRLWAQNL